MTLKTAIIKRSSSKTKGQSIEKNVSISHALSNLGKDVKDEIEI